MSSLLSRAKAKLRALARRATGRPARPALPYRAIGKNVDLADASISDPRRVIIGDNVTIGRGTVINSMGGLVIGDNVGIGVTVRIVTFIHRYRNAERIPFDDVINLMPVVIGDFAWIGWNSCICPGVRIGEGAIVSMGSVVVQDVPPLAIVMGNPAKVIGKRSPEHFEKCKREGLVGSVRILQEFGRYRHAVSPGIRRKFGAELERLGLLDD